MTNEQLKLAEKHFGKYVYEARGIFDAFTAELLASQGAEPASDEEFDANLREIFVGQGPRGLMLYCRRLFAELKKARNPAAPPAGISPAPLAGARTPQDYAIEHAEYMARDAERFLEAVQEHALAHMALDEGFDPDTDQDITAMTQRCQQADESVGEHMAHLRNGIYEFRKRRDRAALSQGHVSGEGEGA